MMHASGDARQVANSIPSGIWWLHLERIFLERFRRMGVPALDRREKRRSHRRSAAARPHDDPGSGHHLVAPGTVVGIRRVWTIMALTVNGKRSLLESNCD